MLSGMDSHGADDREAGDRDADDHGEDGRGGDGLAGGLRAAPSRKSGHEPFFDHAGPTGEVLQGFMSWACSDLLANTMRGLLAEYIVGLALGCVDGRARVEWDAADLLTDDGVLVEVKSSAYLQSWVQTALTTVEFGIAPTLKHDAETNTRPGPPRRQAHVYVFCLFAHRDLATADPLDLTQWEFFVASTVRLNAVAPTQKTIRLNPLLSRVKPRRVRFAELCRAVAEAAAEV